MSIISVGILCINKCLTHPNLKVMGTIIAVHSDELNELKQEIKDLKNLCSTLIEHTKNNIVKPFYTNKDLP